MALQRTFFFFSKSIAEPSPADTVDDLNFIISVARQPSKRRERMRLKGGWDQNLSSLGNTFFYFLLQYNTQLYKHVLPLENTPSLSALFYDLTQLSLPLTFFSMYCMQTTPQLPVIKKQNCNFQLQWDSFRTKENTGTVSRVNSSLCAHKTTENYYTIPQLPHRPSSRTKGTLETEVSPRRILICIV